MKQIRVKKVRCSHKKKTTDHIKKYSDFDFVNLTVYIKQNHFFGLIQILKKNLFKVNENKLFNYFLFLTNTNV